uniref:LIM zinc-binding domain-containing protein n=1 Tax=Megaselia scalaris TaxID=36166 RepID=T1GTY9_MEGSC
MEDSCIKPNLIEDSSSLEKIDRRPPIDQAHISIALAIPPITFLTSWTFDADRNVIHHLLANPRMMIKEMEDIVKWDCACLGTFKIYHQNTILINNGSNALPSNDGKIMERYLLYALDRYWHNSCLKCYCCGATLGDIGSSCYTKAGMILCKPDYVRGGLIIFLTGEEHEIQEMMFHVT